VHVLGAMVWLGGLVCLSVLAGRVLRASERDAVMHFVAALRVVGPVSLAPASIAVVGFGVWLVIDSDAWDFGQTWVILALAVFATAFLVGAGFLSPAAVGARSRARRPRRRHAIPSPLVVGRPVDRRAPRRRNLGHDQQARLLTVRRRASIARSARSG
jgi:uncharacterized membrane protein